MCYKEHRGLSVNPPTACSRLPTLINNSVDQFSFSPLLLCLNQTSKWVLSFTPCCNEFHEWILPFTAFLRWNPLIISIFTMFLSQLTREVYLSDMIKALFTCLLIDLRYLFWCSQIHWNRAYRKNSLFTKDSQTTLFLFKEIYLQGAAEIESFVDIVLLSARRSTLIIRFCGDLMYGIIFYPQVCNYSIIWLITILSISSV